MWQFLTNGGAHMGILKDTSSKVKNWISKACKKVANVGKNIEGRLEKFRGGAC
jgi:hypothetical protein